MLRLDVCFELNWLTRAYLLSRATAVLKWQPNIYSFVTKL